jgi:LuxR family transcriptional regulator, maltose regulon positive regulatory protein
VAWLSLDAGDNDPARFWRHAVAALDRVRPGIGERVGPMLGPPAPLSFEGLVTALINELAAQPGEDKLLLVLDDYHVIDTQQVQGSLMFLLEHPPSSMHLVLASRADPPLRLARLRAAGQLAELRTGDLRFTAEEAAVLLREAIGGDLPGAAVGALAARTEGWAAGLQLAALSLRGRRGGSPGAGRPGSGGPERGAARRTGVVRRPRRRPPRGRRRVLACPDRPARRRRDHRRSGAAGRQPPKPLRHR